MENKIDMLLYRYKGDDLEVYLVKKQAESQQLMLPTSRFHSLEDFEQRTGMSASQNEEVICLEAHDKKRGLLGKALALEHKIEEKIHKLAHIQQTEGTYVAMKEAFKKIMPAQYAMLKELQEILNDRNLLRYM